MVDQVVVCGCYDAPEPVRVRVRMVVTSVRCVDGSLLSRGHCESSAIVLDGPAKGVVGSAYGVAGERGDTIVVITTTPEHPFPVFSGW